jgi:hypothetical protein
MVIKLLILAGALVSPEGILARGDAQPVDTNRTSIRYIRGMMAGRDRSDAFAACSETRREFALWLMEEENDQTEDGVALASLPSASSHAVPDSGDRFVPRPELPMLALLVNRRLPLLC